MTSKDMFKDQLRIIEIETFSYCNRKCWFCPNSSIDRMSTNHIMPESMYLNIINQLSAINFAGVVTYSRYNEPLSQKELILKRIAQARELLPNAKMKTNTNGDYVTFDYIVELKQAGLDELYIQQYLANNELYNHEKMRLRMQSFAEKLGVSYSVISDIEDQRIEFNLNIPGITVHIRAKNMSVEGCSRTEKVAEFNKEYIRTAPCMQPSRNMYIDYDGSIVVCCNARSDVPAHKSAIMGHVNEGQLWDIYQNEKYKPWREHLKSEGPKQGICAGCKSDISFIEFQPLKAKLKTSE
jgi:radical SAM protein with 4Fe4S-binding SPASM domain